MDKGAHFHKCDFQVHTPRDRGWNGADAITDQDRKSYAEELILGCRQKGLHAIAITDHHDFAFFPYVKKAAHDEIDDSGQPIPAEQRIVVFPGIELTLTSPNCQAILILDAEFPENLLSSVLTALAITPAPSEESKTAEVQRIPHTVVSDLSNLYDTLSSHRHLRGRFIVFPNVSESGHGTMLRAGFANFYKTMPCVGGYTDGAISQLGKGNIGIVRGENRDYGFKSIALFQTSDNRRRDHSDLGGFPTFVKWSEPTAEALRQACLAKESRLAIGEPDLPSLWITSMSVSNSKFLSRVEIDFNQQYNAVIGGRGTGKSTILEYLRWALCDQPVVDAESDLAPVQVRRKKLIDDTLQKCDGEVIVTFILNGVKHIVKRNSKTHEILLKIADGGFVSTTEDEVRNLFPLQAYSQKQLSSVSVRLDELNRFVELPIKQQLDQLRAETRDIGSRIRIAYGNVVRKKEIEAELAKYALEIESLSKQLESLHKGLRGLSTEDQELIRQKPLHDNERHIVEQLTNNHEQFKVAIQTLLDSLNEAETSIGSDLELHNKSSIERIRTEYAKRFEEARAKAGELADTLSEKAMRVVMDEVGNWELVAKTFEANYEAAKARAKVNQHQLQHIQDIEKRIVELKRFQLSNHNSLAKLGEPESVYKELRTQWSRLQEVRLKTLGNQCAKFSSLSDGIIKAAIDESLDTEMLKRVLKKALAGLNVREPKLDEIGQCVLKSPNPIGMWINVLSELEKLTFHKTAEVSPLPPTPFLDKCGLIDSEKTRIAAGLSTERWLDLSLEELQFNPVFKYCTNKDTNEFIGFADASAGQQATALLTVLLNQPGAPLIIDQPEDDVASKMSPEIVQQIWSAKRHRQLIFASHNANFVVNGDSELVICCDYVKAGDQTGGQIKCSGAIDNNVIRDEITTVTEGGKQAFELRMRKYGF